MGKVAFGAVRDAAAVKAWERDGFPKINPLTRGRFYPAVVEWLNSRYGLRGNFYADAEVSGVVVVIASALSIRVEDGRYSEPGF
jgi:hypothetical protein